MPRNDFINVNGTINYDNITSLPALNAHATQNATLAHGGLILGTLNTDLNKIKALPLKTDTRTTTLTYTSGVLTSVVDADGATTVKTTTLTYTSGVLTSVAEVAGGTTVTTTLNYTSGVLTSVTKAVA